VSAPGVQVRQLALAGLRRIDEGGYANLVVPALLGSSNLDERDRAFVAELVYGTTRRRRSCDWLVDRHLHREVEPAVRAALRLGAYQLCFAGVAPHAAVSATVEVAPARARGLVNAVLRRVSEGTDDQWPDLATELSYPDWIVQRLVDDLGADMARGALDRMNEPPPVTERADGYVQDAASQWVAAYLGAEPLELVADVCSAPGGKATALAQLGAFVVAGDLRPGRVGLVTDNARRLGLLGDPQGAVAPVVADATCPPLRPRAFSRVLVDAPCSGLGVLRRRPDARWRVDPDAVGRLAELQRRLVLASSELVAPGGRLVFSVCTLTAAETTEVADHVVATLAPSGFEVTDPPGAPWQALGRGARLLPQTADTDGMFVLGLSRGPR
jgi:16S rRNA (cytosine967-C5)-methyltransferase